MTSVYGYPKELVEKIMKANHLYYTIVCALLISMGAYNKAFSQKKESKIKIWCLRKDKSEILFKIENDDLESLYIPEKFFLQYKDGQDTLYFDALSNKKFAERSFYYYSQFGGSIITNQSIKGIIADSIKNVNEAIVYNQFIAPKLVEIKPNTQLIKLVKMKLPLNLKTALFRIYSYNFDLKDYSYNDFIEFEKKNSFSINSVIYEVIEQ